MIFSLEDATLDATTNLLQKNGLLRQGQACDYSIIRSLLIPVWQWCVGFIQRCGGIISNAAGWPLRIETAGHCSNKAMRWR